MFRKSSSSSLTSTRIPSSFSSSHSILKCTPILLQRGGGGRTPGEGQYFDSTIGPNQHQKGTTLKAPGGREGKAFNPFAPEISSLRRLLVIINPQSGWKEAAGAFAAHVTETLDTTGVLHKTHTVPPEELKNILREECKGYPQWDSVLLCGGDGMINSYSYLMTIPEFGNYWLKKPVGILPAGTNNGIAHSLGLGNPGSTTASFISGRRREVPLWKATVHNHDDAPNSPGTVLSTAVGGINFGLFADTLISAETLKNYALGFVVIPVPRNRNYLASLYHLARLSPETAMPISVRYTTVPKEGLTQGGEVKALNPGRGLHMLVASQMKWHHKGYSLTPKAEYGKMFIGPWFDDVKPWMSVTIANGDASKARMMHLLQKEAPEAELELEDGVETFDCQSIEICFSPVSKSGKRRFAKQKFLLDGEQCELLPGQTLKLAPAGTNMTFMIP